MALHYREAGAIAPFVASLAAALCALSEALERRHPQ